MNYFKGRMNWFKPGVPHLKVADEQTPGNSLPGGPLHSTAEAVECEGNRRIGFNNFAF